MPSLHDMPEDYRQLLARTGPGTFAGVLRLLAPDGPPGFDMRAAQQQHRQPDPEAHKWGVPSAILWGVFESGETCWWLPIRDTPSRWLVLVAGRGFQQLNISTTDFLQRWAAGSLDLPVLSLPPMARNATVTPAGEPVAAVPELSPRPRDPLAQLATIIGPAAGGRRTYDWPRIERELGLPLPADYKRLFAARGPWLALNGIRISAPDELKALHDNHDAPFAGKDWHQPGSGPGGLLLCATTEGRDLVCWDTSGPVADAWPVVSADMGTEFTGTLTELAIAELTGAGLGLTAVESGDPAGWAWPFWGPDEPW